MQFVLSIVELVFGFKRNILVGELSSDSVIVVSIVGVTLPLKPQSPEVAVINLHLSSLPLLTCVLNLPKVSGLVFLDTFSAKGHVN